MLEDKKLIHRFNQRDTDAMRTIYQKYKDDLLGLAFALLNDKTLAHDVLHDVFVSFATSAGSFKLTGSLKSYLATCTANRARDKNRTLCRAAAAIETAEDMIATSADPPQYVIQSEQSQQMTELLAQLPYDQREIIILHLHHDLKFRQIAKLQKVSINTIQSRYRYGINKLKANLTNEAKK
jgi:RNA polymerase sigma-70 factor (ECF subfamily)